MEGEGRKGRRREGEMLMGRAMDVDRQTDKEGNGGRERGGG